MIQVKFIKHYDVEPPLNKWLRNNKDKRIIDIKFYKSEVFDTVMIIYEIKEGVENE